MTSARILLVAVIVTSGAGTTLGTLPSAQPPGAQLTPPAGECAATWELDDGLCYPACPSGFGASGPVCLRACPAGYVDEGLTCRNQSGTIRKESRPRGGTQLTRSAYRDLFVKFVQLYRTGAAFLATPLTEQEKAFLRQFFPERLLENVRVSVVPMMNFPFLPNVRATTIGADLVVVKDGERSDSLLKHELVHVCQVDRHGLEQFIRDYADQYVDVGYDYNKIEFEREAYGFADINGRVSDYLGYCQ